MLGNSRKARTVFWRLLTLAWTVQIFLLSTSEFNSGRTESLLLRVLAGCGILIGPDTLDLIHIIARKLSHGTLFAVLALLVYRALGGEWLVWRASTARRAIAAAALYGMADEFHQLFVPDRGASLFDCGIDAAGAALAVLLLYGWGTLVGRRGGRVAVLTARFTDTKIQERYAEAKDASRGACRPAGVLSGSHSGAGCERL